MSKRIALIEPFFTSSHKQWSEQLSNQFDGLLDIYALPGRHWKWRMHGAAVSLAKQFLESDVAYDVIIASDMLDLGTFTALCRQKISGVSVYLYMHENQLTYPWSPEDQDVKLKRDNHYGFINYASALVADKVFFNSHYHKKSFLSALPEFLKQFPDHHNLDTIAQLEEKSNVLYLGLDLDRYDEFKHDTKSKAPLILWNHRWEYDKNPDGFLDLLRSLKKADFKFELAVMGESYAKFPKTFNQIQSEFSDKIVHWGYVESFQDYARWLWQADILPVTSNQDFFGISVVEAAYCQTKIIAPNRLAYPEYIQGENLYDSEEELLQLVLNHEKLGFSEVKKFDWKNCRDAYRSVLT